MINIRYWSTIRVMNRKYLPPSSAIGDAAREHPGIQAVFAHHKFKNYKGRMLIMKISYLD
jgi:hypothetical protein